METSNRAIPTATAAADGPRPFAIAINGDFIIQLTPPATPPLSERTVNSGQPWRGARVVQFRVSRAVMQEHSTLFRDIFRAQPNLTMINFESKCSGFGYALEIWLRAIHNGVNSLPENLKATHMERAWVAIGVGESFGFAPQHLDKIKPWFLDGYNYALNHGPGLSPMMARCLAFPCSVFDYAEGFMKLTKYLAYNTNGNIFTYNPSNFQALASDARVLDGPLTTARAHIQSVIDRELFFPLEKLHRATCVCRKETAFDYEATLRSLGCWPVDQAVKQYTLADIIDYLSNFNFTPKTQACDSGACYHDFKKSVDIAIQRAKEYFDGLCLDCTERSLQDEGQSREDYIQKNSPYKDCWDMNCRFGHGRPSWYFSWMGPSDIRRDICSKFREEKRQEALEGKGRQGRRGKRAGKGSTAPRNQGAAPFDPKVPPCGLPQSSSQFPNNNTLKENPDEGDDHQDSEIDDDDDDEFFDAEDTSFESQNVAADDEDAEGLDHYSIN